MRLDIKIALIGAAAVILAAIIGIIPGILPGEGPEAAEIIYPKEGAKVPNSITVKGIIANKEKPENRFIWLLVGIEPLDQWWPQGGSSIKPINGEWSKAALIGGGPDKDIGKEFQIAVVLVEERVDEDLNKWVTHGNEAGEWPAISLPEGKVLDKINVIKGEG